MKTLTLRNSDLATFGILIIAIIYAFIHANLLQQDGITDIWKLISFLILLFILFISGFIFNKLSKKEQDSSDLVYYVLGFVVILLAILVPQHIEFNLLAFLNGFEIVDYIVAILVCYGSFFMGSDGIEWFWLGIPDIL